MDDPALDEGRYVDLVLARTGVPGYSAVLTGEEFARQLDQLAAHQGEPFTSASVFASFLVHRLARTHGVTVMLGGQGADEYLAGYSHYVALHLASLARRGLWPEWYLERAAIRKNIGVARSCRAPACATGWRGCATRTARRTYRSTANATRHTSGPPCDGSLSTRRREVW